jgi:hypothetical protein
VLIRTLPRYAGWTPMDGPIRALRTRGSASSKPGLYFRSAEPALVTEPAGRPIAQSRAEVARSKDSLDEPQSKRLRDRLRPGPGSEPQLDVVDQRLHGPLRVPELFSDRPCVGPLGKQGQHLEPPLVE